MSLTTLLGELMLADAGVEIKKDLKCFADELINKVAKFGPVNKDLHGVLPSGQPHHE
jgi:hypothetical protein